MNTHAQRLLLIGISLVLSPAAVGQNLKPETLDGTWRTDKAELVRITLSGQSLVAAFIEGAVCPNGGTRDSFIQGTLQGNQWNGSMIRCTRVSNLVQKCGLNSIYQTTFKATVSQDKITGTYRTQWFDSDPKRGDCKYTRNSAKDHDQPFTLTRACKPDSQKLCTALNEACKSLGDAVAMLNRNERPSVSFNDLKDSLSSKLGAVKKELCDNPGAQRRIDGTMSQLAEITSGQQRDKLENLQREINSIRVNFLQGGGPCNGIPPSNGDAAPSGQRPSDKSSSEDRSSGKQPPSDESQCKPGEQPKSTGDDAAITRLVLVLKQQEKDLAKQSTVVRQGRQAAAIRIKLVRIRRLELFWQQVRTQSCLPPEIPQLIRRYLEQKGSNAAAGDTCAELCTRTAEWVRTLTGSPLQASFDERDCLAACN